MKKALEDALLLDLEIESAETPESKAFDRVLQAALQWRASQLPGGQPG